MDRHCRTHGLAGSPSVYMDLLAPWTIALFAGRIATWHAPPPESGIVYELHVGTFTPEGTLDAAIGRILTRISPPAGRLIRGRQTHVCNAFAEANNSTRETYKEIDQPC